MGQKYGKTEYTHVNGQFAINGEKEEQLLTSDDHFECSVEEVNSFSETLSEGPGMREDDDCDDADDSWATFMILVQEQVGEKLCEMEEYITKRFSEVDAQLKDTVARVGSTVEQKVFSVQEQLQERLCTVDEVGERLKLLHRQVGDMIVRTEENLGWKIMSALEDERKKLFSVQKDFKIEHKKVRATVQPKLLEVHEQLKVMVEGLQRVSFEKNECQREQIEDGLKIKKTQIILKLVKEENELKEIFVQKQSKLNEKYDTLRIQIDQRISNMKELSKSITEHLEFVERRVVSVQGFADLKRDDELSHMEQWFLELDGRIESTYKRLRDFLDKRMEEVQCEQEQAVEEESSCALRRINLLKEQVGERLTEVGEKLDSRLEVVHEKVLDLANRVQRELDQTTDEIQEVTGLKLDGVRKQAWQMLDEQLIVFCQRFNKAEETIEKQVDDVEEKVEQKLLIIEKDLDAWVSGVDDVMKQRLQEMIEMVERKLHEVKYDSTKMLVELLNHITTRVKELSVQVENRDQEIRSYTSERFVEVTKQLQWRNAEARGQLQESIKRMPQDINDRLESMWKEVAGTIDEVESWLCNLNEKLNEDPFSEELP